MHASATRVSLLKTLYYDAEVNHIHGLGRFSRLGEVGSGGGGVGKRWGAVGWGMRRGRLGRLKQLYVTLSKQSSTIS